MVTEYDFNSRMEKNDAFIFCVILAFLSAKVEFPCKEIDVVYAEVFLILNKISLQRLT